jgi:hypothetical protein
MFKRQIQEKFISFLSVEDRTGEGLALWILKELRDLGRDPNFMVGQAYDGYSVGVYQLSSSSVWRNCSNSSCELN